MPYPLRNCHFQTALCFKSLILICVFLLVCFNTLLYQMTLRAFSLNWKYGQINQQIITEFCFFSFSPFGVVYHGYLSASFYRIGFGMITISFCDRWQPVWWQRMPDEWTPLRIMTVIRSTCRHKRHLWKRKKKKTKKQGYSYKLHAMWEKSVEHRLKKCVWTPQKSPLLDS